MSPRVSILLPTYNGARTIRAALESVRAQTYSDWELFVIDDGSTDDTEVVVSRFVTEDSRIIYLKNEQNLGIQKTLNRGLQESKGVFIARIDDDDLWIHPEKLKMQVAFLDTHIDHAFVGTNGILVDEQGKNLATYHLPETDDMIRPKMLMKNCFLHPSIVMRRDLVRNALGYDERPVTRHIEDYALWLRLGLIGLCANLDICGVQLTVRPGSLTFQNRLVQARNMRTLIRMYRHEYPHYKIASIILWFRIVGFQLVSIVPLPTRLLYTIQKLYKNF